MSDGDPPLTKAYLATILLLGLWLGIFIAIALYASLDPLSR